MKDISCPSLIVRVGFSVFRRAGSTFTRAREFSMLSRSLSLGLCALAAIVAGCTSARDRARADSMQALALQQGHLMDQLTAQRDSVARVLGDADSFISRIDSSISRVKGLSAPSRSSRGSEGPLEDQVRQRKEMLHRVDALVERARETAKELSTLKERERRLVAENGKLKNSVAIDEQRIAELKGTIEQQAATIASLQTRLDEFDRQLAVERAIANRAYYVIGTEDELVEKGVIVREGGTNLLIKRIGRTLVPARQLDTTAFKKIDTRQVHSIDVPDTTRRYQIVSRQSLDDVRVGQREGTSFRGALEIPNSGKFWAASRYLIIVQR